jgi:LysR family transcriptional activator of nhaA
MKLEQLNFHHLFYFWRVARLGHLTRAAEALHTRSRPVGPDPAAGGPAGRRCSTARAARPMRAAGQPGGGHADEIFGLGQEMLGRLQGGGDGVQRLRIGSGPPCPATSRRTGCARRWTTRR